MGTQRESRTKRKKVSTLPEDLLVPSSGQVGEKIFKFRVSLGLTQEQLSKRSGISVASIGSLERGLNSPSFESILRLSHGFDLEPPTLLSILTNDVPFHARTVNAALSEERGLSQLISCLGNALKNLDSNDLELVSSVLTQLLKKAGRDKAAAADGK